MRTPIKSAAVGLDALAAPLQVARMYKKDETC